MDKVVKLHSGSQKGTMIRVSIMSIIFNLHFPIAFSICTIYLSHLISSLYTNNLSSQFSISISSFNHQKPNQKTLSFQERKSLKKMAHKITKKEETEFQVPETITPPCINPTQTTTPTTATTTTLTEPSRFFEDKSSKARSATSSFSQKRSHPSNDDSDVQPQTTSSEAKRAVNRCSGCRKRVGLTGFRCRCGDLFCSEHRYSDRHDCSYDYKAAGRESIARENPVVKAAKIVKL